MEALPVLLMIVLIIIVVNQNYRLTHALNNLEKRLKKLQDLIAKFPEKQQPPVSADSPAREPASATEYAEPEKTHENIFEPEDSAEDFASAAGMPAFEKAAAPDVSLTEAALPLLGGDSYAEQPPPPQPALSFFERHPDMEKFIGENLVSKIGIAVLVLAIGFFVKYAIDRDWVGAIGRVSIGMACGGILSLIAHRMRNSYRAFSSLLAGGGTAIFYFTVTLAYREFHIFSQAAAFIIMVAITIFAVLLALLYNKQELAVTALVGGFASPFLASSGAGNYAVLFTYLIILNSGLLIIAFQRSWRLLNLLSFIFTATLFGIWLSELPPENAGPAARNGFLFAALFYLLFFIINIAYNIRGKQKFIASDFGILLANTGLFFAAGLYCLHLSAQESSEGLFSASLGIFNLAASYFIFRKNSADKNILYLLIGLTMTFVSITAPLQLHGHYITLFWAAEAVLLYWLYQKSRIALIRISSAAVWMLMIFSLLADWAQVYADSIEQVTVIANKGFITGLCCAIASYAIFLLKRQELPETFTAVMAFPRKNIFRFTAIGLLFLSGALETNQQFSFYYPETGISMIFLILYALLFLNVLIAVNAKPGEISFRDEVSGVIAGVCLLLYVPAILQAYIVQNVMLTAGAHNSLFVAHWLTAAMIAYDVLRISRLLQAGKSALKEWTGALTWVLSGFAVFFLSHEALLAANEIFYSPAHSLILIQSVYIKSALPVLWGICSFILMWLGMRYHNRSLRVISLSLFLITLLKLFIFDISNVPAGGKIAAFFSLGVLLLVVSFMYQRLKKIIIDNEKKP